MKRLLFMSFVLSILAGCNNNNHPEFIEASGTIEAIDVIVSAKTAGEILSIRFKEGEKVNAGDTILIIDHELLDIQLKQAEAGKEIAEARLNLMKKGAREEDIIQAEENLKQAEINLSLAKNDKERMENLYKSKSITTKQYEDALARFDLASAQFNAAKENLHKVKNIYREEEIKQAEADLKKSIAAVELLMKNIKDSYVVSPINGYLTEIFVEKGETVSQMSSLFKVADLDVVELEIYVTVEELGYIKLQQKAEIKIDSYKDKRSEEHTSDLQSRPHLVCRLLLEKKKLLCYCPNLGSVRLAELCEAVGIIAAQSICEPGIQLTMRIFPIGGTSCRVVDSFEHY